MKCSLFFLFSLAFCHPLTFSNNFITHFITKVLQSCSNVYKQYEREISSGQSEALNSEAQKHLNWVQKNLRLKSEKKIRQELLALQSYLEMLSRDPEIMKRKARNIDELNNYVKMLERNPQFMTEFLKYIQSLGRYSS